MPNFYSFSGNTPYVVVSSPGGTWNTLRAASGSGTLDNAPQEQIGFDTVGADVSKWHGLDRGLLLIDTADISSQVVILSGQLQLCGGSKGDGCGQLDINIYQTTSTSDDEVLAADFSLISSTPLCDTPISYANWSTAGYNTLALNAAGIAAINRGGVTKIGIRNANYDVAGIAPPWAEGTGSTITWLSGMGSAYKNPILTLTYKSSGAALGTHYYKHGIGLKSTNKVTLESIRNLEVSCMGRFYIDAEGNACYEPRTARNP